MLKEILSRYLRMDALPVSEFATFVILSHLYRAVREPNLADLDAVVRLASCDDMGNYHLSEPALATLPAWKQAGIERLVTLAERGRNSSRALAILIAASERRTVQPPQFSGLPNNICPVAVEHEVSVAATRSLRALMLRQLSTPIGRSKLLSNLSLSTLPSKDGDTVAVGLLAHLIDINFTINEETLREFRTLLDRSPILEEILHKFLAATPSLIDPLALEIRSKHELGNDFVTDFVVRRINDEYVLVEIEKPTDRVFNKDGGLAKAANHAVVQVRDFQQWVTDNISYAQKKLPGIVHPEGLVVIGRRSDLTPTQQRRLAEENFGRRGHIKIVTFDDLFQQATNVYANMLSRHPKDWSKDRGSERTGRSNESKFVRSRKRGQVAKGKGVSTEKVGVGENSERHDEAPCENEESNFIETKRPIGTLCRSFRVRTCTGVVETFDDSTVATGVHRLAEIHGEPLDLSGRLPIALAATVSRSSNDKREIVRFSSGERIIENARPTLNDSPWGVSCEPDGLEVPVISINIPFRSFHDELTDRGIVWVKPGDPAQFQFSIIGTQSVETIRKIIKSAEKAVRTQIVDQFLPRTE